MITSEYFVSEVFIKMDKLEQLKSEVEKLSILLKDPQPGIMCWHGFLKERIESINEIYYGKQDLEEYENVS